MDIKSFNYTVEQTGVWLEGCEEVMTDCGCHDPNGELDCYKKALNYIRHNLTFEPNNACEVLAYVQANFNCIKQEIVRPDKPIVFPELNLPHPDPDSNDDLPHDDDYDEDQRKPIWWYHSDHLGSSTYLTDNFGRPSHYYETLPFGEMIVEHNQSTTSNGGQYENSYKFNGKELDEATQLYYYGARYYDPRISIFISVDPLAEKTMTPYQYVTNNPIMFTDPTGIEQDGIDTQYEDEYGNTLANTNDGNNATVIISSQNSEAFKKDFESTPFMMQHGELANAEWMSNYGEGMIAEEGAKIQPWAIKAMGHDSNFEGIALVTTGLGMSLGEKFAKGATFRLFNKKGTNFSPKYIQVVGLAVAQDR